MARLCRYPLAIGKVYSLVLPSWLGSKTRWFIGAAILLLVVGFNLPLVVSRGYQNLAFHSLTLALTMEQPQLLPQAEGFARQAAEYDPQLAGAFLYHLGLVKQQLGLPDDAYVDFQAALQKNNLPNSIEADLLLRVGLYQMQVGEDAQAEESFQRLLELGTEHLPAQTLAYANVYLAAILRQREGDLLLERPYLESALNFVVDATTMDHYLSLIARLREAGGEVNLRQALEMAVIATSKQPTNTWAALARCNVHLDLQEVAEAITWCQRATALDSNNHRAHVWLGIAYAGQELWEEALAEYELAATLTTENEWYLTLAAEARSKVAQE
jgi:tetratricopeptide (TPR) repeat protein